MGINNDQTLKRGYNKMIIDSFIEKKAVDSSKSIHYSDIDLPFQDREKRVLLNSLIKDGFVQVNEDNSMWFDRKKWRQTTKKISNVYFMILIIPIIITVILMLILNRFI